MSPNGYCHDALVMLSPLSGFTYSDVRIRWPCLIHNSTWPQSSTKLLLLSRCPCDVKDLLIVMLGSGGLA